VACAISSAAMDDLDGSTEKASITGSGTRKMFMPKQKLHTHEEVFKDHVSGQYDETIFRFRVPGGWIYTHTIIRFGSVEKHYVADTFVPDSTVDMELPIHPRG
jgi:hypothetical protein